jgi:hypothetical protein
MGTNKTIQLTSPIELHGQIFKELAFKEPTGAQYLDLGEPKTLVKTKDNSLFWSENDFAIARYLEVCAGGEFGPVLVKSLSLADARKAKEIILSFFTDPDRATSEK